MSQAIERQQVRGAGTVFSDYASVLGARLVAALLSLVAVLMMTRILGPDGYGVVAYVSVIALLIFTVTSAWTSTAVSRYGREEFEHRGSTIEVTWSRVRLTAPLLAIAALIVVSIKLVGGFPAQLSWGLTWLAISFGAVLVVSEHVIYSLDAIGRMKTSAVQLVTRQLLVLAGLAGILIAEGGQSPDVVASILVAGAAISTLIFGSRIFRISLWPPRSTPELRRKILRFSVPLIAFTVSQYAIRSVDLIVIGAFVGASAVGVYAVAYQAYGVLQQLDDRPRSGAHTAVRLPEDGRAGGSRQSLRRTGDPATYADRRHPHGPRRRIRRNCGSGGVRRCLRGSLGPTDHLDARHGPRVRYESPRPGNRSA